MKRLFFILMLILPSWIWAENIPQWKAEELAVRFLSSVQTSRSGSIVLEMVCDGTEHSRGRGESGNPPFYVFNNTTGKGFVIVSGEDVSTPVLGYSFENNFPAGGIPINLQGMMDHYTRQINYARSNGYSAPEEISRLWKTGSVPTPGNVVLNYKTAHWDQEEPDNDSCFVINGTRASTGCVATATAIVMRHHGWPEAGKGYIPSYSYKDVESGEIFTVPGRQLGHSYNWKAMPMVYDRNSSVESRIQIARLMADLGVMLRSCYSENNGTGACNQDIPVSLIKYMDYAPTAQFVYRRMYSNQEWSEMMQNSLKQYGPIVYGGEDTPETGHAFVLEGFTDNGYYSFNLGWGGYCNGYYKLDAINVDGFNLKNNQDAIIGIKKNEGEAAYEDIILDYFSSNKFYPYASRRGMSISDDTITYNRPFTLFVQNIMNNGTKIYNGLDIDIMVTDKNYRIKEKIGEISIKSTFRYREVLSGSITCLVSGTFTPGDRICLFYHPAGDSTRWERIKGIHDEIILEEVRIPSKDIELGYNRSSKDLTLRYSGEVADLSLVDPEGRFKYIGKIGKENVFILHTLRLKAGKYFLHINMQGYFKELSFIIDNP